MIKPEAPTKVKARPLGREFLIFWFGQSTSIMGTAFTQFGLPLLVFRLTGSAFNLALAQISIYLPYVLFGLFIGAWTDRMDRKKLLIWVNFLRGLVIISIPILAWLQGLNVAWIYIISFLNSILAVFSSAATSAVVPSLVEKDQLVAANGRISVTDSISRVAGPVLAGFLVLLAPLEMVFLIDSLSFFVAAGTLLLIESSFNPASSASREKSAKKNVLKEIKEGLVFL
jgi:MFS family permease